MFFSVCIGVKKHALLALLKAQPDTHSEVLAALADERAQLAQARAANEQALRNERARRKRLVGAVAHCSTDDVLQVIAKRAREDDVAN